MYFWYVSNMFNSVFIEIIYFIIFTNNRGLSVVINAIFAQ